MHVTTRRRPQFHPLTVARGRAAHRRRRRRHLRRPRRAGRGLRLRGPGSRSPCAGSSTATRRAPLLLDLRAGRRRAAGRRARDPRRALLLLAGARGAPRRPDRGAAAVAARFRADPPAPADHVFIAAGSGITPMLSIAAVAAGQPGRPTVTVLYGNRRTNIGDVRRGARRPEEPLRPPARSSCTCSPASRATSSCSSGRLDADRLRRLRRPRSSRLGAVDHVWLCGPFGDDRRRPRRCSAELGVPPSGCTTSCSTSTSPRPSLRGDEEAVDGPDQRGDRRPRRPDHDRCRCPATSRCWTPRSRSAADLPFACKGGVCGTCRARVTDGEVDMRRNYALEPARSRPASC